MFIKDTDIKAMTDAQLENYISKCSDVIERARKEFNERKSWQDKILEATKNNDAEFTTMRLFEDDFNACPPSDTSDAKNQEPPVNEAKTIEKAKFDKDLPFEPVNHHQELEKEIKEDVEQGLLDSDTAKTVLDYSANAEIYTYANNTLIVHKPDVLNIEVNSKDWFKNFLYNNYVSKSTDIRTEDMIINYDSKKHILKSLVWVNQYGVKFFLDIKKYVHFLDNYVF